MRRVGLLLISLLLSGPVFAVDNWAFTTPAQEQVFQDTLRQLRCPKCQNNSIADSTAPVAADMRQKVYELVIEGKTQPQIVSYMVARYGNFVNYDPPLLPGTLVLWLLPGLFVVVAGGVIVGNTRRRKQDDSALFNSPSSTSMATARAPVGTWVVGGGIVGALVVSTTVYFSTTNLTALMQWREAQRQYPQLEKRVMSPQARPLSLAEIATFELGLRTRLAKQPKDLNGWRMLGRIGLVRGQSEIAIDAFAHALTLAPDSVDVKLDYADVLVHAEDMATVRQGALLLKTIPLHVGNAGRLTTIQRYADERLKAE